MVQHRAEIQHQQRRDKDGRPNQKKAAPVAERRRKPQIELSPREVGKGGIVRNPDLHRKAQDKIVSFVKEWGCTIAGIVPSVIKGTDGNQEFFACIQKQSV